MSDQEAGVVSIRPAFRFTVPSEQLKWVRTYLMRGGSLEIAPVEGSRPELFQIREFDASVWPYETMALHACDGAGLGAYILEHEIIAQLGVDLLVTRIIDEALASGFSAFLIAPHDDPHCVAGQYTLITAIADNS